MDENQYEELATKMMAGIPLEREETDSVIEYNRQMIKGMSINEQCNMLCNSMSIALVVTEGLKPDTPPPFIMTSGDTLNNMVGTAQTFIDMVDDNPLFAAQIIAALYCTRLQEQGALVKGFIDDDIDTPESFDC